MTSKLQVTIPKAIAAEYGIAPGDDIEFQPAGEVIRIVTARGRGRSRLSGEERLRLFDAAMERQRQREKLMELPAEPPADRGWKREDLYTRGETR